MSCLVLSCLEFLSYVFLSSMQIVRLEYLITFIILLQFQLLGAAGMLNKGAEVIRLLSKKGQVSCVVGKSGAVYCRSDAVL